MRIAQARMGVWVLLLGLVLGVPALAGAAESGKGMLNGVDAEAGEVEVAGTQLEVGSETVLVGPEGTRIDLLRLAEYATEKPRMIVQWEGRRSSDERVAATRIEVLGPIPY